MVPLTVYVETSVWNFAFTDDSPEFRQHTHDFLQRCREGVLLPYISVVVLEEIANAPPAVRDRLLRLIDEVGPEVLSETKEAKRLADAFVREHVVPASKPLDALHVAIAFLEMMDALVSWNFRHIASLRRSDRFNAVAKLEGVSNSLRIMAPSELAYDE